MDATPGFPTPLGVLRAVDAPRYETQIADQVRAVIAKKGEGDLAAAAARRRHVGGDVTPRNTFARLFPLTARRPRADL